MADQNFKVKKGLDVGIGGTVITTSSSGNVGLGTTNPTVKLWVNGDGFFIGSVTSSKGFYVNGELVGSGAISGGNIVGTGLSISGISTFGNSSTGVLIDGVNGIVTSTNPGVTTVTFVGNLAGTASTAGFAATAFSLQGFTPATGSVGFATTSTDVIGGIGSISLLSVSGVSTFGNNTTGVLIDGANGIVTSTNPGITTVTYFGNLTGTASTASFATTAFSLSGFTPVTGSVGFATTATNLGAGNTGSLPYQISPGITTFLNAAAINKQVLLYNTDTNKPEWGSAGDAQGSFAGIDVKDEDNSQVSGIKVLNIRGDNITAVSDTDSGISTITVSKNLVGTALSISGISTFGSSSIGVKIDGVNGIVTSTNPGVTTVTFVGNLTGTASTASFASTAFSLNGFVPATGSVGFATTTTNLGAGNTGSLPYQSSPGITTFLSAPGSTNQVLLYSDGTNQPIWSEVGLGTNTTGNYVKEISGTDNEIKLTPSATGAGTTHQIGFVDNPTIQGTLKINQNLNVLGNITIGGTTNSIVAQDLILRNKDIILGLATDINNNNVSTDFSASGGGIAIASTEGFPIIDINAVGFETNPTTYKKIMWFRANDPFVGLKTDAWLSNYAFGIGTTSMSFGTRFAAGNVEISHNDITAVRNIKSTGISTFGNGTTGVLIDGVNGIITSTNPGVTTVTFVGNLTGTASTAGFAQTAFNLNGFVPATGSVGFATTSIDVIGGIGSLSRLTVSGLSTFGNSTNGVLIDGVNGIVTSTNPGVTTVTYYGDGSKLSNIISGVSISTNTTNQTQLITYVTGTGSTTGFGVTTSGLVFNPSGGLFGISTSSPSTPLQVERYGVRTGLGTFNAVAGITTDVDSFVIATTDFKTAEYTVHIQSSSSIQAQKVLVMQNGTSAFSEEYAIMYDPNFVVSIGATVSGPFCKLQFTPETGVSGLVTYRFTRETML